MPSTPKVQPRRKNLKQALRNPARRSSRARRGLVRPWIRKLKLKKQPNVEARVRTLIKRQRLKSIRGVEGASGLETNISESESQFEWEEVLIPTAPASPVPEEGTTGRRLQSELSLVLTDETSIFHAFKKHGFLNERNATVEGDTIRWRRLEKTDEE